MMDKAGRYILLPVLFFGSLYDFIGPAEAAPGNTPEYPTRFVNTNRPMESLLKDGYRVSSMTMGIDTIGFMLEHDGKWVMCSVRNSEKPKSDQMLSQCFSMN